MEVEILNKETTVSTPKIEGNGKHIWNIFCRTVVIGLMGLAIVSLGFMVTVIMLLFFGVGQS